MTRLGRTPSKRVDGRAISFVADRVAVQGWSKEEALKEMTQGGFGFHEIRENLVRWMNGLDIDRIKKKAEIE